LRFQIGVKGGPGVLLRSDFQSQIVRHSKYPSPWVLDFFALSERGIQPQKHLLGPLLRLRGIKPKAQQVTVYILASFQKQLSHLILQRQGSPVPERETRKLLTKRIRRHHVIGILNLSSKTPWRPFQLHRREKNYDARYIECSAIVPVPGL
jgi:hypothetical protein